MAQKLFTVVFTLFAIAITFLLSLIIMTKSLGRDVITLKPNGNKQTFEVELVDSSNKHLVPMGHVISSNETDKIELKYNIKVSNGESGYTLMSKVERVLDQDDKEIDYNKYLIIKKPNDSLINRTISYIISVELRVPESEEEYNFITSLTFALTTTN